MVKFNPYILLYHKRRQEKIKTHLGRAVRSGSQVESLLDSQTLCKLPVELLLMCQKVKEQSG